MELIYKENEIVDVQIIRIPKLNTALTKAEKLAFFACDHPDLTVCQNIAWLEQDERNEDGTPKTTLALTVASMVTAGLITQERADEILA